MKRAALVVLSIAILATSATAEDPHPKLKPLAKRIGSWTADLEANGQVVGKATSTWSWILDSKYMKVESEFSLPEFGYEGKGLAIWGWSAEKNGIQVTDFNSQGQSRQYIAEIKDGKVVSPAEDGNQFGVVKVVEEHSDDGIKSVTGIGADGSTVWQLTNFKKKTE